MSIAIQLRGGTALQHASFTGRPREITVVTDTNGLRVHDGVKIGGYSVTADGKADKATTLAGYGITDAYTKAQTNAQIDAAVAAGGGGSNTDTPAQILTKLKTVDGQSSGLDADLLDGKNGADYVLVASRGQPNGIATLDASSHLTPSQQGFAPDATGAPAVFVPLYQRLGQEVVLTDGYVEGSNLTDFSDLIEMNIGRAVATKRPFFIPSGDFTARRRFSFSNASIFMYGAGKAQAAIVWANDATSTGLRFAARKEYLRPDYMHFSDFMLLTAKAAEGLALECDFGETVNTVFNPNDPTIFDRHSSRFLMEDVSIRGLTRETVDGWQKGVDVLYPIDAMFRRVHFAGLVTNAADPQTIRSDRALYAGAVDGRGHPTGTYYDDCNLWNVKEAVVTEGCEGMVARGNQIVNVHAGLRFRDPLGRPLLQANNNHINAHGVCIEANAASQIQVCENSLYHTLGTDRDGVGISITGPSQHLIATGNCFESAIASTKIFTGITVFKCDHGVIDGNTFRTGVVSPNPSNMRGIVLASDARFIKVGNLNVFENPQSGRPALISTITDGGFDNRIPGMGARYVKTFDQYVSGETVISFSGSENVIGALESMADGGFSVRVDGIWAFTFGVVANAQSGGHVLAIKKNGTGTTALVSDSKDYSGATPIAMHVTTGPILVNKDDILYPMFTSQGTSIRVHPATFFEARRIL